MGWTHQLSLRPAIEINQPVKFTYTKILGKISKTLITDQPVKERKRKRENEKNENEKENEIKIREEKDQE